MAESKWTLDGEPVESIEDLLMVNDFDDETRGLVLSLNVGEEMVLGGGAGADFVLRREA